jgi:type II secretory pathway component GspD/PulD (secretin)
MAVDDRGNAIVASGTPARLNEVEAILVALDGKSSTAPEAPRSEIRLVSLAGLETDQQLEETLRLVFAGDRGRFVVNRQLGVVVLSGERLAVEKAVLLMEQLASLGRRKGDFAATELQVRIFWLVSGPARKDAAALPEGLEAITAELTSLGINKPSLATQVTIRAVPGGKFESGSVVELAGGWDLSVSGTVAEKNGKLDLQITTSVSSTGRRNSRRAGTLRTQTTIPLDRPTVVGVIPTAELNSAFVVQVSHKPAAKEPQKGTSKRAAFEFRNKPWSQVFEWLSDTTGLPVIASFKPTGTFTFMPPSADKRYTLPQIMDILNEALLQQKLLLLRTERSITLLPADEAPHGLIPRVQPQDFKNYGETELVSVVIPLRNLVAEDLAPDVKKMLGPFGKVAALKAANSLQVDDMAGNIRRVVQMIVEIETRDRK